MSGDSLDLTLLSDRELDNKITAGIKKIVEEKERRIRSESKKETCFLRGILVALKEKLHTDIQLRPGKDNGPCIPAHRAILASRSKVFKQMLECVATPDNTITIPEMNSEEVESLLVFLYSGSLYQDTMEKQARSLIQAADKYEIPYLQERCERYIVDSMNASNVLDALEISDAFSSQTIMDSALKFVIENMESITVSPEYGVFAARNPHLAVQITRAFVNYAKIHLQREVARMQKEVDRLQQEVEEERTRRNGFYSYEA